MKVVILIDNMEHDSCVGEWGLSIYIEYGGEKILLDAGTTGCFAENAKKLGIDLKDITAAVLSHAHYDHCDGMEEFFARNKAAKLYLRKGCEENCYSNKPIGMEYIGIRKGFLEEYRNRLVYAEGDYELLPGVMLIPHKSSDMEAIGRKANMFVLKDGKLVPERFAHEQSLVFETEKGLAIFNSCCHAGADQIIREVADTYPGKPVYALIGGLHLFRSGAEEVHTLAERIRETDIKLLVTGHCTGAEALEILQEELGSRVVQMYSGLTLNL